MNTAYLILAHEQPLLLERLVDTLSTESSFFFIHIDKKTDQRAFASVLARKNVFPADRLFNVFWAGVNMVKATLSVIRTAWQHPIPFDYYVMLSGTDYPIKSNTEIHHTLSTSTGEYVRHYKIPDFETLAYDRGGLDRISRYFLQDTYWLNTRPGKPPLLDHMSRAGNLLLRNIPVKRTFPQGMIPYGGWQHMILTHACVTHVLNYIEENPQYLRFFRFAHVPDEIAIQTLIMNSDFRHVVVNDNLKYIDYSADAYQLISDEHFTAVQASPALFARKFGLGASDHLLDRIDRELR